jgi:hypothetical protein
LNVRELLLDAFHRARLAQAERLSYAGHDRRANANTGD